jgi:aspartyl-tRNA(Asn)/glutamyl-tRNA(Gln) amidotransferase subunit B
VVQETRLYDPDRDETRSMRSKEDAQDYRYFPDPDLPPLVIAPDWVETVRAAMPELPQAMRARFETELGLSAYDAAGVTATRASAAWFEAALAALAALLPPADAAARAAQAKQLANWMLADVAAALNRDGIEIDLAPVSPALLARLLARVIDGTVSGKIARELFAALWAAPGSPEEAVDREIDARGLRQISDTGALEAMVDAVLAANPKSVEEFRAGKDKAFNALVGQVMKASRGKANPQAVNDLLRRRLGG